MEFVERAWNLRSDYSMFGMNEECMELMFLDYV